MIPDRLTRSELLALLAEHDQRHTPEQHAAELDRQIENGLPIAADGTIDTLDSVRWNLKEWIGG